MSEMLVNTPVEKHTVEDYDIVFSSGMMMPITVDITAGDTIAFNDNFCLVHLVPKPSKADPEKLLSAEDVTVFMKHVVSIQHRKREVAQLTTQEKAEWQKMFKEMSGTVQ